MRTKQSNKADNNKEVSANKVDEHANNRQHFAARMDFCAKKIGNANLLASRTNISRRSIGNYLSGESDPSRERLIAIARAAEVSVLWLATGEGHPTDCDSKITTSQSDDYRQFKTYSIQQNDDEDTEPCPSPIAFHQSWLAHHKLDANSIGLLTASNDAMKPTIVEGDYQLVDSMQTELLDGHVYIFNIGGQLIARRVQTLWNKGVMLHGDNPEYKSQLIENSALDQLDIVGRVISITREI